MFNIPSDIFENDLSFWLEQQTLLCQQEDKAAFVFLERIPHAQMFERDRGEGFPFIEEIKITAEEEKIIHKNDLINSENIEIKAYCLDLLRKKAKDKRGISAQASDAYLQLAVRTQSPWFLIRAITVRSIKAIKSAEFVCSISDNLKWVHPNWYKQIAEEMKKTYSSDELQSVIAFINQRITQVDDLSHRDNERACLDALKELGSITEDEWHYRKALSFESELDYSNETKGENTILALAPQIAQDAFKEISFVWKKYKDVYDRLKAKLIKEQKFFVDMMGVIGVKETIGVPQKVMANIDKCVQKMELDDPMDLLSELAAWPMVPAESYDNFCKQSAKASPMLSLAFGRSMLGDEGQNLGSAEPQEALRIEAHRYYRNYTKCAVVKILQAYWQKEKDLDEESLIKRLLSEKSSQFVELDRKYIWVSGFVSAIKDDFLAAVHLLTPQIERYLVKAAEHYCGSLKSYERTDHQDEGGLMKALTCLKPHLEECMYEELYFYLLNGADTNLRSNIAHGLWPANRVVEEGPYLFWLALKMCFREGEIIIG